MGIKIAKIINIELRYKRKPYEAEKLIMSKFERSELDNGNEVF